MNESKNWKAMEIIFNDIRILDKRMKKTLSKKILVKVFAMMGNGKGEAHFNVFSRSLL